MGEPLTPGKVYLACGEPHLCLSVNKCRAVIQPTARPWAATKLSVSPRAELREVTTERRRNA
jgi:hypothetical protein